MFIPPPTRVEMTESDLDVVAFTCMAIHPEATRDQIVGLVSTLVANVRPVTATGAPIKIGVVPCFCDDPECDKSTGGTAMEQFRALDIEAAVDRVSP